MVAKYIQEPEVEPDDDPIRPLQTFKEVFSNRPFRLGAFIYLVTFAVTDVVLLVLVRFLIDYVQVDPGFDNLILAVVLGVAFVFMPVVVRLMETYGKRKTYIGNMIFLSIVLVIMSQVPPGGQNLVLIAAVLGGIGFGAANTVPWAIVADVVEADELVTGKRREGIYAGYLVFFRKLASAFAVFVVGQVLSATGFISGTTGSTYIAQPESALLALRFFVGVFPAIALILATVAAWRYPLDKSTYNDILQQLEEQRATSDM